MPEKERLKANHRGWTITYSPNRPVTGVWRAERYGVGMCAGTYEAIIRMIDNRNSDDSTLKEVYALRKT